MVLIQIETDEDDDSKRYNVDLSTLSALNLCSLPISCTLVTFEDKILVDPTEEEENFADSKMTVVLVKANKLLNKGCTSYRSHNNNFAGLHELKN